MDVLEFAVLGLGIGAIFGLLGMSIAVVNLGSGVLNFAAGAIGMIGAYAFYAFRGDSGLSDVLAALLALVIAAGIGAATHLLIMRPLANAPATSRIVAALGLMTTLMLGVTLLAPSEGQAQLVRSPFPTDAVHIGSEISVGADRLIVTALAVVIAILLTLGQRRTRIGLAVSAVAENRLVAASMGWSPNVVGATAWAVGSVVAAIAAILAASFSSLSASGLTFLVVPSMAAALIGRFQWFSWTLLGALAIGVAQSEVSRFVSSPGWPTAAPLLVIVVVLALRGDKIPARTESSERRPAVGTGHITRAVPILIVLAAAVIATAPITWLDAITTTLLFALVVLSVVVITGYAGQLSLAQASMAALGSYFTALFAVTWGMSLPLAVVAGVAACTPAALLIALPALRTRGANLAIATLAFATALDSLVMGNPERIRPLAGKPLGEFRVFGVDLSGSNHPTAFALTALGVVAVVSLGLANLRRSRGGRRLLAVRSNERAAASLGISVAGVKLYAFWLSTMIAALAGALVQARFSSGDFSSFRALDNINAVLFATIGGLGWIAGAIVGAFNVPGGLAAKLIASLIEDAGVWLIFLGAVGAIAAVLQAPDGAVPAIVHNAKRFAAWVTGSRRKARGATSREVTPRAVLDAIEQARTSEPRRVTPAALRVENVSVRFGSQMALRDVSLSVESGEIVGLIGPNGAGKSTLIDVITGFQRPTNGTVLLNDRPLDRLTPHGRARAGLSRSFQALELFDDMTVLENLRVAGEPTTCLDYVTGLVAPGGVSVNAPTAAAIGQLRLTPHLAQYPGELDFGKRRLVAIARALSSAPAFVLLDEPAAGLDETERRGLKRLLRELCDDWGVGILLIEHDVQLVLSVCSRVIVLDEGAVIASGEADVVQHDPAVIAAYLGEPVAANGPHARVEEKI